MKTKPKYSFNGYDWTELANYFHVKVPFDTHGNFDSEAKPLQNYLKSKINYESTDPETVSACRAYLKALIKMSSKYDYSAPLWKGLLKIKHDWTFMQYFIDLLPCMWT
jgi:hypothetical protein